MRSVEDAETRITAGQETERRDRDEDYSGDAEEYETPVRSLSLLFLAAYFPSDWAL